MTRERFNLKEKRSWLCDYYLADIQKEEGEGRGRQGGGGRQMLNTIRSQGMRNQQSGGEPTSLRRAGSFMWVEKREEGRTGGYRSGEKRENPSWWTRSLGGLCKRRGPEEKIGEERVDREVSALGSTLKESRSVEESNQIGDRPYTKKGEEQPVANHLTLYDEGEKTGEDRTHEEGGVLPTSPGEGGGGLIPLRHISSVPAMTERGRPY